MKRQRKNAIYSATLRAKRRRLGRCLSCGREPKKDRLHCAKCLLDHARRNQKSRQLKGAIEMLETNARKLTRREHAEKLALLVKRWGEEDLTTQELFRLFSQSIRFVIEREQAFKRVQKGFEEVQTS